MGAFRSLGRRLMHPPPPSDKERYFLFVAPRYDVALEDVVANKHLPPLSAQDFEDYLRFAEGAVQNLYFYLWLQRYRSLHNDWASAVLPTVPSTSTGGYRPRDLWERLNPCQDRTLKEEFAHAKSRWLDFGAPTRLDIPEQVRRAVLDIPNLPPRSSLDELTHRLPSFPNQPSPSHFDGLLQHVKSSLQSAFARFLRIAFSNGGLWHACIGHVGSTVLFLAPGLALWTLGVSSGRRGMVAGSLPLLWLGFSLALMCLNKHCFAIYATGDARQLYPYENIRPLPSEHAHPPPVYSLGVPPQADDATPAPPPYEPRLSRKTSGILSIMSGVTGGKRPSGNGVSVGMSNRRDEEDEAMETGGVVVELDTRRTVERAREMDLRLPLPPARKTKDLPLRSLGPGTLPTDPQDTPGLRVFTEDEDFGIVVSEAYEEDEVYPFPIFHLERTQTTSANENETGTETAPGSSGLDPLVSAHLEPPTPACSVPEPTSLSAPAPVHSRRGAMGDIFSFGVLPPPRPSKSPVSPAWEWVLTQARPESKQGDVESGDGGVVLMDPHWRSLFGPMTLVHDPLVRRAHWAVTVRCAMVGCVVVCGMAFGLIR
ncbi:regulator of G protein signaling domain protein [Ceratobasidium sp. AG-Ba]|nr:regulator of G protein signaling domain protein [Ceratobasidium sp. AG-Ba]QRW14153.1 regulator of G protein signaling domain protein [Ceratobasidium sp. AG-Ba]